MKKARKIPRNSEVLGMFLTCKGGVMRDRRERRPKDARKSWKREWL